MLIRYNVHGFNMASVTIADASAGYTHIHTYTRRIIHTTVSTMYSDHNPSIYPTNHTYHTQRSYLFI